MNIIAQILACYLFLGSLIPRTDFGQLVHLPDLVQHYQLHVQEAKELGLEVTFFDFLEVHFLNPVSHQHDKEEDHQNLPFQHFHTSLDFVYTPIMEAYLELPEVRSGTEMIYCNNLHLNGFVNDEIRPPSAA